MEEEALWPTSAAQREAAAWRALIEALAGSTPLHQFSYHDREEMKTHAGAMREMLKAAPPAARVSAWLLHAFSHWLRTHEQVMTQWPGEVVDEEFPHGLTFRRYLCAWLSSVGRSQLKMSDEDLEAVYEATGCGPIPHELLPPGASELRRPFA